VQVGDEAGQVREQEIDQQHSRQHDRRAAIILVRGDGQAGQDQHSAHQAGSESVAGNPWWPKAVCVLGENKVLYSKGQECNGKAIAA